MTFNKKIGIGCLSATLCLSLSGCATMFSPSQEKISLTSDQPNTTFYQNGQNIGTGQTADFNLKRSETATMNAQAPGCSMVSASTSQRFNRLALLDIFTGGLGFIVDGLTGAIETPSQTSYNLTPVCTQSF